MYLKGIMVVKIQRIQAKIHQTKSPPNLSRICILKLKKQNGFVYLFMGHKSNWLKKKNRNKIDYILYKTLLRDKQKTVTL